MNYRNLILNEIEELAQYIQSYIDGKKGDFGFAWGNIFFYYAVDKSIIVTSDPKGKNDYVFTTHKAVAEFVILNLIPNLKRNQVQYFHTN